MEFGLTTGRRVKKAESNLASYQKALKQHENKKVFETMMSLAQFGELTPERYAFFMSVVSNQEKGENKVEEYILNRSFKMRDRKEYVSKNEAYALAQTVKDMFVANGIEYEVQQAVCKERSPEASVKVGPTGIKFKLGLTWKTTTVTKLTPRGGIFDD